jgi:hypothetical protein
MTLHRHIDRDLQMTPIDFQVTGTKVKVTVTKVVFTQWLPVQRTAHMWGMHVLQTALVSIDFSKTHQWIIDIQDPTVDIICLQALRQLYRSQSLL